MRLKAVLKLKEMIDLTMTTGDDERDATPYKKLV